ncbi:MAG: ester cyclase [Hyalangium sp.]|uniref:ester cyclase n=1 Tax=Hyalangium sp. TaxID=2028555 RepID=UPI00389AEFCF
MEPTTQFMQSVWTAFPDMVSHEDAIFGEGDRVVIQWTIDATHKGNFFGVNATNKPIHVSGMDVLRVKDGKFVEHWGGLGDQIDVIFQQIQQ